MECMRKVVPPLLIAVYAFTGGIHFACAVPANGKTVTAAVYYTVRPGDTLSGIAEKFHTQVQSIVEANDLLVSNPLYPGTRILVYENTERQNVVVHRIRAGETLWGIAQVLRAPVETLLSLNPRVQPEQLPIGSCILVPSPKPQAVAALSMQDLPVNAPAPVHFAKTLICKLTAYGPGYVSTGKRPGDPGYGVTASGASAREGRTIAVDPRVIPIGSRVYIEGIGYRIAEDTGSAIKGEHIDVFFNDDRTATVFGVRRGVRVYILP
jgi:3D (Asp-Asp-Asp) domain-containing protein